MVDQRNQVYAHVTSHTLLSTLAGLTIIIGILAFAGLVYAAGTVHNLSPYQNWGDEQVDPMLIAASIGILFQSLVGYAALKGLSDAISILKFVGRQVDSSADPAPKLERLESAATQEDSNYILASVFAKRTGRSISEVIDSLATKKLAGKPINGAWHVLATEASPEQS